MCLLRFNSDCSHPSFQQPTICRNRRLPPNKQTALEATPTAAPASEEINDAAIGTRSAPDFFSHCQDFVVLIRQRLVSATKLQNPWLLVCKVKAVQQLPINFFFFKKSGEGDPYY
jgi:hypothetical protein